MNRTTTSLAALAAAAAVLGGCSSADQVAVSETTVAASSQNETVVTDLSVDPTTLTDELTESWNSAVDQVESDGLIDAGTADAYTEALREAFTYRVNWNGTDATPAFEGI